jgi:hypothetical protein
MPAGNARVISETIESVAVTEAAPAPAPRAAVSFDFSNLALAPMDGQPAPEPEPVKAVASPPLSLGAQGGSVPGAVLILAGLMAGRPESRSVQ